VGIKYIVIKWGFLPIFEDILYTKNLECPITMPTYFSAFYMVYNDTKVWEKMADQEIENDTLRITIIKKDLDNKSILLENDFLIEGSTLEGMYVYAYFNNLNYKYLNGTIQFYIGDEKIQFKDYVENKKSLLAKDYDGLLPSYTSMLEPGGEIVNYQQLTFVEGFNILNEILEGIMYINFENTIHNIQNSNYVKT